eukprot:scaffold85415_cov18-Tisochrysis_lutea.AAC.1
MAMIWIGTCGLRARSRAMAAACRAMSSTCTNRLTCGGLTRSVARKGKGKKWFHSCTCLQMGAAIASYREGNAWMHLGLFPALVVSQRHVL